MSSQKTKKTEAGKKRKPIPAQGQGTEAETSTTAIRLSGNLRIDQVATYQQQLREALKANERVALELQEVEQLDLSFVQMLIAARKTARQLDKSFVIRGDLPDELRELLKQAGLYPWPVTDHEEANPL